MENTIFSQVISKDKFLVLGVNYRNRYTKRYLYDYERMDIWATGYDKAGNRIDSFGNNGISIIPLREHSYSTQIHQAVVDKQGRVLIAGTGDYNIFLCRLLPDGELDDNFGDHGFFRWQDSTYYGHAEIQIDPQGNLFLFSNYWSATNQFFLLALDDSGQLRENWGNEGLLTYNLEGEFSYSVAFQANRFAFLPQNKFWILGGNGSILQLNPNGSIDRNFGNEGLHKIEGVPRMRFLHTFWPISEDTILVSCALDTHDPFGFTTGGFIALDGTGSLLTGFGESGILAPPEEFPVPINPPQGLIRINNSGYAAILRNYIFKFDKHGIPDPHFGYKGFQKWKLEGRTTSVVGLFPVEDSSLLFVGKNGGKNYIGKLTSDGSLDPSYHDVGFTTYLIREGSSLAQVVSVDAQGHMWTAGPASQTVSNDTAPRDHFPFQFISQYTSSGEHVWTQEISQPSRTHCDFFDLVHLQNGRTLAIGAYGLSSSYAFVRAYLPDGKPDNRFGEGSFAPLRRGRAYGVLELPSGQIYVSGRFQINSVFLKAPGLICLDEEGLRRPTTFGSDRIAYREMDAQSVQFTPDIHRDSAKRIYISGTADNDFFLLRFLPNGDPDSSFGTNGLSAPAFHQAAINHCIGSFFQENHGTVLIGTSDKQFALTRLDEHGEIDLSFGKNGKAITTHPQGNLTAYTVCELPDQSLLVGGKIKYLANEEEDFVLACYDENGQLDTAFGNQGILSIDVNGSDEAILDMTIAPDSNLILAGHVDDRMLIVKLLSKLEMAAPTSPAPHDESLVIYPNPLQKEAKLRYSLGYEQPIRIKFLTITGQQVASLVEGIRSEGVHDEVLMIPEGLAPGWYVLVLEAEEGRRVVKVMVGGE